MKRRAIQAPEWLTKSAIYQINPRTFSSEGTISAVIKELPLLAQLGFGIMYLCPIFEEDDSKEETYWSTRQKKSHTKNPKNPYRINDYFKIDKEYGTEDDLRTFINESHRLGMRVLLDLVYMHIGPYAPILKSHPEFAKQDADGNIINSEYHFPYLDFNSAGLREYLWSNMTYYIGAFDADGFRCDVGDAVPIDFWVEGRRRMRAIKPDSVLINEGFNWDSTLCGFDAIYCFDWHEELYSVFSEKRPASVLRSKWEEIAALLPAGCTLLRDIDNHDTVTDWPTRTETVAGHDGMEFIEMLNYFIDGVPMIYCGNELADTARVSMFANRFHMGNFEVTDRSVQHTKAAARRQSIFKHLNEIKRTNELLLIGKTEWLDNSEPDKIVSFARVHEGKKLIVIGNTSASSCTVTVESFEDGKHIIENGCEKISDKTVCLAGHGYIAVEIN